MVRVPKSCKALVGHRWPRFFCAGVIFVLIFWYPWKIPGHLKTWESRQGDAYILMPDSPSYIDFRGWTNPWQSVRPLGYPAFLYPFLYPDQGRFTHAYYDTGKAGFQNWFDPEEPIYTFPKKLGMNGKFEAVVLA